MSHASMSRPQDLVGTQDGRSPGDLQDADVTGPHAGRFPDSASHPRPVQARASGLTYLLALLLLSLFAWAPLLYPGYLQVHSGFLPVLNLADLAAATQKLRWLPAIGGDGTLFRTDGALAYWLALPLRTLLGDVAAIKAVFALSLMAAGLGTFAWTRRALRPAVETTTVIDSAPVMRAALLAAVLLILWPLVIATVYVRGALAEALLIGLLPWALWAVTAGRSRAVAALIASAIAVALLFLVQAGLALWALPLLLAAALWPGAPRSGRLAAAVAVALGGAAGITVLWLLHGAAAVTGDMAAHATRFAAHAVYPYQLLTANWGYGVSTPGWQDGMTFQLGLAAAGLAIVAGLLLLSRRFGAPAEDVAKTPITDSQFPIPNPSVRTAFALIAAAVLVLLATTFARPLWTWVPLLAWPLTYPWQLLVLVGPLLALAGGSLIVLERRLTDLVIWAALVAFVVLASYPYLTPRFTQVQPDRTHTAIFGDGQLALLAAKVEGPGPAPAAEEGTIDGGQVLTVTVSWQGLVPLDFDYNVFVHALDDGGNLVSQWDGQPQREGKPYPMTGWPVGEIVTDSYLLAVDPATPVRQIELGLYNWQTADRLETAAGNYVGVEVGP